MGGEAVFREPLRAGSEVGQVPGAPAPSGREEGTDHAPGPDSEALALGCADAEATALAWSGNAAPLRAPAGDGGREGDKEPACRWGERPRVRVLLFVASQTTLDSGAPGRGRGADLQIVGICLFGAREGGQGTRAREGARPLLPRAPLSRASPLREALPYLSHRPPPRSPTCILKAPCSPGIGPGRVLRA